MGRTSAMSGPVMERILKALRNHDSGLRKTELANEANVNYTLLSKYLALMEPEGMVTIILDREGHGIVKITDYGIDVHERIGKYASKKGSGCQILVSIFAESRISCARPAPDSNPISKSADLQDTHKKPKRPLPGN